MQVVLGWYRWFRRQVIGRVPWGVSFGVYRLIRRTPRMYFLLRLVVMGEMAGPPK